MEVLQPYLLDAELDLIETVVLHHLRDEVDVHLVVRVHHGRCGFLLEELAEVLTNGKVN